MSKGTERARATAEVPDRGDQGRSAAPSMFSSLSIRSFRYLWLANVGFFAATQMWQIAQGWVVYEITGDPLKLGVLSAVRAAAMLVCSLFGGVIADRVVKRNLMMVTQVSLAIIAAVVGTLLASGLIQYWHLLVAAVAFGSAFAFNMPARHALIADVVGDRRLLNAVALNTAGTNVMRMGAPALAGFLLAAIGAAGVYYFMVGCYFYVIVMMLTLPQMQPRKRHGETSIIGDLRAGVSYLLDTPILMTLIGAQVVYFLIGMPFQMLMPVFARDVFAVGPEGLGTLMAAVGGGALIGSLAIARLVRYPWRGLMLLGAGMIFGTGLIAFAISPSYELAIVCLVFVGFGTSGYMALNNGLIMGTATPAMRGRIMSMHTFIIGLQPLGTLPLSALASSHGAPAAVGLAGAILLTAMIALAVFRPVVRRLR